jgi:hypothetical protein
MDFGDSKIYYNNIIKTRYNDIPLGLTLWNIVKICSFFDSIDSKSDTQTLFVKYKILYEMLPENIDYNFIKIHADDLKIATPEFLIHKTKEICQYLIDSYKYKVIVNLITKDKSIFKNIINYYLSKTPIGGKEKRGWDSKEVEEMYNFVDNNAIIILDQSKDMFKVTILGTIYIKEKDVDKIGEIIHSNFTNMQLQKKIDQAEAKFNQEQLEISLKKTYQEWEKSISEFNLINTDLSLQGNECIIPCSKRKWDKWTDKEVCACPVQKYSWFGTTYNDTEECDAKKC